MRIKYAGRYSTQTAGCKSTQTAGYKSTQKAGDYSTQTAGNISTQIAGNMSYQYAGINTVQISRWYSNAKWNVASRIITEKEADVWYYVENGVWVEKDPPKTS